MNGRKDRILIPSAVALIAFSATLLLASVITKHLWLNCISSTTFDFPKILVSTGIITVGIGYFCHALFTGWTLRCRESRLVDFPKLISAFGLSNEKLCQLSKNEQQKLEDELLAEFHLRLHSHAPRKLIEFCTRRNTEWYVAITSLLALWFGYIGALVAINLLDLGPCSHGDTHFLVAMAILFIIILIISCVLFFQGTKWNREFWAVCWKWIYLDVRSYPFPSEWPERMKNTDLETIIGKLK